MHEKEHEKYFKEVRFFKGSASKFGKKNILEYHFEFDCTSSQAHTPNFGRFGTMM